MDIASRISSDAGEAVCAASEATRAWPQTPLIWHTAALANLRSGRPEAARADLAVALALDPEDPLAYYQLAVVLAAEGRRDAAMAVLESGWATHTSYPRGRMDRDWYFRLPPSPAAEVPAPEGTAS